MYYAETISKSREIMFKQLTAFFDSLQLRIEEALKVQYDRLCASGTETVTEQLRRSMESLSAAEAELSSKNCLPTIIKYIGEGREMEVEQLLVSLQHKKNVRTLLNIGLQRSSTCP